MRLADRIGIVVVLFRVTEEEDVLVVGRRPSLGARRHRVGLMPDTVASQLPAGIFEPKTNSPRNAQQFTFLILVTDHDPS